MAICTNVVPLSFLNSCGVTVLKLNRILLFLYSDALVVNTKDHLDFCKTY